MILADIDNFIVYDIINFYNPGSICIINPIRFFPKEISNCTMLKGMIFESYREIIQTESLPGYNLEYLTICRSKIVDISALAKSKSLTLLILNDNNITDISVLSKCVSLETRSLKNNKIEDTSALSKCTALTHLYLEYNKIVDISHKATIS